MKTVLEISIVRIESNLPADHADHTSPGTVQFVAPLLVRSGGHEVAAAATKRVFTRGADGLWSVITVCDPETSEANNST